ncbi:hypothetical protein [Lactococcus allomyrinae]|uniref:Uncharacterized protein n=1 Tax=Lactococcus allomyrinae TaxID=2419773 RepID=A0A387BHL0_9LACT|nr:hypothetical protein [Lactococcus allomyrinae]AYG01662.1 hypothetical protein D7I46_11710 [Lactococcus allomyrinae]
MKKITFTVTLDGQKIRIDLPSGGHLRLFDGNHARFKLDKNEIFFLLKKRQIKLIASDKALIPKLEFDQIVILNPAGYDLETAQLTQYLVETAEESGLTLVAKPEALKLPKNIYNACAKAADEFLSALSAFDIKLEKKKFVSPKAQHRWKKAIADIVFHVDYQGAKADIIWEKSTEMRIKKGAKMLPDSECPKRADGSLGLAWTFTKTLRDEHKTRFDNKNWVTTEDIILRSVNEVSYFLYFAGTNSWLLFIDDKGRSIHELTVVSPK